MKRLPVLFLLLFFANEIFAQVTENKFHFGLKVNPFLSWLKTDHSDWNYTIEDMGSFNGISYGIFGEYYFAESFGISSEVRIAHYITQYSFRYNSPFDTIPPPGTITGMNRKAKLQYIAFPLALKIRSNKTGNFRFYGQFGFAPAINLKANANDTYFTYAADDIVENNKNVKKEINKNASSVLAGAGLEYYFNPSAALLFGITYHAGNKNLIDVSYREFDSKLSYVALNIGVIF